MAVITISREYGSEGEAIAGRIAQALAYRLVDKELIGSVLSRYGLVEFDREYDSLPGFWDLFSAERGQRRAVIVEMLNQVLRAVAQRGDVVILGRSGFAALAGYADVLHVRLQAPFPVRVARVMAAQGLAAGEAEALVKESDRVRAAFVEGFYGVSWGAAGPFDLVINTATLGADLAVAWAVDAVRSLAARPVTGLPLARDIAVDATLARAVAAALE